MERARRNGLVSAVVPNYNYGEFIADAIDSLARQTWSALELVVVDDGSTDDSPSIIRSLAGRHRERFERIDLVFLETNRGKLHALNRAIPRLRGEVTLILDSDDYLAERYVEETIARLRESRAVDPGTAFAYTDCWLVDASGNRLGVGKSSPFDGGSLEERSYIPSCGPTLTSVLQGALPFDETIRIGTKHHRWRKLVRAGARGVYHESPLFYYRMHDRNLSGIGRRTLGELRSLQAPALALSTSWPCAD